MAVDEVADDVDVIDVIEVIGDREVREGSAFIAIINVIRLVVITKMIGRGIVQALAGWEVVGEDAAFPTAAFLADRFGIAVALGIEGESVAAGEGIIAGDEIEGEIIAIAVIDVIDPIAVGVNGGDDLLDRAIVIGAQEHLGTVVLAHQREQFAHDPDIAAAIGGDIDDDVFRAFELGFVEIPHEKIEGIRQAGFLRDFAFPIIGVGGEAIEAEIGVFAMMK